MINEFIRIANFMADAFLHIWPYLVITIPIAVAVNMSGASKYIKRAFDAGPVTAILLATLVGALSPFCSCGVIPVIAALLIAGVPLAPVMSFWIASPSMDPEIFFLSVGTIGWNLAVWRLMGTLALSLLAGFITYFLVKTGWIPANILKAAKGTHQYNKPSRIQILTRKAMTKIHDMVFFQPEKLAPAVTPMPMAAPACCNENPAAVTQIQTSVNPDSATSQTFGSAMKTEKQPCGCNENQDFFSRLTKESFDASLMVIKFMALAFFLEALIILYIPEQWITGIMGKENAWAIFTAAFLGIPVYTSNLSALPMVSGLLTQGMSPAAALAFLIAGPTTTLPAMAAVWTLVTRHVFILYISIALLGAIILGYSKLFFG